MKTSKFISHFSILLLGLLFFIPSGYGQKITSQVKLPKKINETSGLIKINGRLITHTDSGGKNELYEINEETGEIERTVKVINAKNYDWESITHDTKFIYIGDIGNNVGNRKNLVVYKVSIDEYFSALDNEASAEQIKFSYADQESFMAANMQNDYDAEALLSFRDSLYIFSKNWVDMKTRVYPLSKIPGEYTLHPTKEWDVECLITDATYNPTNNTILLIGYNGDGGFIFSLNNLSINSFYKADLTAKKIPLSLLTQIEGITYKSPKEYYLTCEEGFGHKSKLFVLEYDNQKLEKNKSKELTVFLDTSHKTLYINKKLFEKGEVFDNQGQRMTTFSNLNIDVAPYSSGMYFIMFYDEKEKLIEKLKFIIP